MSIHLPHLRRQVTQNQPINNLINPINVFKLQ
jgi:hypothetical protein